MTTVLEPGSELDPSGCKPIIFTQITFCLTGSGVDICIGKISHIALASLAQWLKHWPAD